MASKVDEMMVELIAALEMLGFDMGVTGYGHTVWWSVKDRRYLMGRVGTISTQHDYVMVSAKDPDEFKRQMIEQAIEVASGKRAR